MKIFLKNNISENNDENNIENYTNENKKLIYSNRENESTNILGLIQLYKNLENKFDKLEKEIEEGKKNKYEYKIETDGNRNINNKIYLTNTGNKFEYEKNYFLENLYKEEKKEE